MQSMVAQQETDPLEIEPSSIGTLELAGAEVPYVDLEAWPFIGSRLVVDGTEYTYNRSFNIQGHSAVMPAAVAGLQAQSRKILVVERKDRYYVYVA
jgi:hypothetical protein